MLSLRKPGLAQSQNYTGGVATDVSTNGQLLRDTHELLLFGVPAEVASLEERPVPCSEQFPSFTNPQSSRLRAFCAPKCSEIGHSGN